MGKCVPDDGAEAGMRMRGAVRELLRSSSEELGEGLPRMRRRPAEMRALMASLALDARVKEALKEARVACAVAVEQACLAEASGAAFGGVQGAGFGVEEGSRAKRGMRL